MNYTFDAPPEGATPTGAPQRALKIEYASGKIPEDFAEQVTEAAYPDRIQRGKLGFSYYNAETKVRVPIIEFTFVVLEVCAGIDGFDKESGVSYWSNRSKDTRTEPLAVFASNHKGGPIASGMYQKGGIVGGEKLPAGAKYTKFVRAYCVQLDRVVEIALTSASERGMQKGIEAADHKAGRTKTKWESVFILSLADNDHLWGFHLTGYRRVNDKGLDYAGKGDLYIEPVFHAGVLNPTKQAELWNMCREYQENERAAHEAYRARYASQPAPTATHTPQAQYQTAATADQFPTLADVPPVNDDDQLPF